MWQKRSRRNVLIPNFSDLVPNRKGKYSNRFMRKVFEKKTKKQKK